MYLVFEEFKTVKESWQQSLNFLYPPVMALCLRAVWTVLGVMSNYLLNAPVYHLMSDDDTMMNVCTCCEPGVVATLDRDERLNYL